MSVRGAAILFNSSASFAQQYGPIFGSSSPSVTWAGGRSMLHVTCPSFPIAAQALQVQQLQPDNSTWLQVGSGVIPSGIAAAGMWPLDTSPGQYRVACNSGIVSGLYVALVAVPYGI